MSIAVKKNIEKFSEDHYQDKITFFIIETFNFLVTKYNELNNDFIQEKILYIYYILQKLINIQNYESYQVSKEDYQDITKFIQIIIKKALS